MKLVSLVYDGILDFCTSLSSLLLLLVPQKSPQDLARGTFGNNINEFYATFKPLMPGFMLLHVFLNLTSDDTIVVFEASLSYR